VSITPASDIVLDVARAADPARSAAAIARLARLAETEPTSSTEFTRLVEAERVPPSGHHTEAAPTSGAKAPTKQHRDARTEAVEGLERLVLQKLVESMLPKESSTVFGHGTAGDVWRSMLAEQLAAQIGAVVDLGIGRAAPWLGRSETTAAIATSHDDAHQGARPSTDRESRS